MNTGVEILLKRMADCPEDFDYRLNTGGMSRWMRLVDHAIADELLTLEEHEALKAGLKEMKRQRFTEMVMKELAGVEDETSDEGKYYATPLSSTGSNNTGLGYQALSTITAGHHNSAIGNLALNSATLNEEQLKHMKAHMDALNKVEVRKKATLR
jgi:predicted transcriptional regulator